MAHFLENFKRELPEAEYLDLSNVTYSEEKQMLIDNNGLLIMNTSSWYTNSATQGRYVPGHRTKANKWIVGHRTPSKTDRRKGK